MFFLLFHILPARFSSVYWNNHR